MSRLPYAFLAVLIFASTAKAQQNPVPRYIGSETCVECHDEIGSAWRGSHHALAWTLPDDTTVLGDFDGTVFEHKDVVTRFSRRDGDFLVETEDDKGEQRVFKVVGVAGIAPLQQYLVELEPGRIQALDVAWDAERKRWYHLYPEADLPAGDGLHWTGPYKSWNARCAECHATGFEKNYDPRSRQYSSTQAEIGVGCEACHGPAEAHVSWARDSGSADAGQWAGLTDKGFTIGFAPDAAETEIQLCAGCHSRREPYLDGNPLPGTAFHDAYRLALLRDGLYHADGSILDEVYVYGSFLQSKMYAQGVRCTDCHDPHKAELKFDGNAICTQCHSPAGNSRFPSLRKAAYDDVAHHFHEPGSAGAQCASCHMIERDYMGIDGRRDHSFRIPRPDLSVAISTPNACTDCHADRDAAWAANEIALRFPDADRTDPGFAPIFSFGRSDPAGNLDALIGIAEHDAFPGIVRASALDLAARASSPATAERVAVLLEDGDPLVRAAAIPLQRGADAIERVQRARSAPFRPCAHCQNGGGPGNARCPGRPVGRHGLAQP